MNRAFPLKVDPDLVGDLTSVRFGKQRLVKNKKPSQLKEAVRSVAEAATHATQAPVVTAPAADSAAALLQKTLLDLSRFQRRAKEENPLKAAKAQRLICGIREISRCLESAKVPIAVIAACNIQDAPVLEELANLEISCKMKGVVFLSNLLSRNQLGKAAGKAVRQAAVAIISVEGANATWKKLLDSLHS